MVDEARAKELLEKAKGSYTDFEKVSLTNKSFSVDAAKVLAETFSTYSSVVDADLSDMIAGRPEEEALQVLETICNSLSQNSLFKVDLSDNALGEKGILACSGVLKEQDSLVSLRLCNNGLSCQAMDTVTDLLLFRKPTRLMSVHFYNNMSGDGGALALAKLLAECPCLQDLRFSGTRALRPGSLAVAKALQEHKTMVRLDLADNVFPEEGGLELAKALEDQPSLNWLSLRDCGMEDEAGKAVLSALCASAPGLRHLDLSGNDLTVECAPLLAQVVLTHPKLTSILYEENELESKGAKLLANALKREGSVPALTHLQLNSCMIQGKAAVAITTSLFEMPSLEKLELNGNQISAARLEELRHSLQAMGKLQVLGDMDENEEDEDEEEEEDEGAGDDEVGDLAELTTKLNIGAS